jgi:hypothetical protein
MFHIFPTVGLHVLLILVMHIKGGKHFYVSISLYCLDVKVTENFNFEHRPKKIAHNLLSN